MLGFSRVPTPALAVLCGALSGCSLETFVLQKLFVPEVEFDPQSIPMAPDYSQSDAWYALPEAEDQSDLRLPGASEPMGNVPIFFVHPTIFLDKSAWLQDLSGAPASVELMEQIVLPSMVSLFNECCDVYVPKYRTATIGAYYVPPEQATPVFQVAYDDVDRAFSTFIERHAPEGPFMVASHSQGSMHAHRLLRRIDSDPDLYARLVAAYVPGQKIPMSDFGTEFQTLVPCTEESQSGCIASWNTVGLDYDPYEVDVPYAWRGDAVVIQERQAISCTNPVTGSSTQTRVEASRHRGAVIARNEGSELQARRLLKGEVSGIHVTGLETPLGGLVSTRCDQEGLLRVDDIRALYPPAADEDEEEYHFFDLSLFYVDTQGNALRRIESWSQQNLQTSPLPPPDQGGLIESHPHPEP